MMKVTFKLVLKSHYLNYFGFQYTFWGGFSGGKEI